MTIHKDNIEAFLLDYLEGNLDALMTAELMAYLSENPEYEKWIPEYDGHVCLIAVPVFEDKPSLKKDFHDVPVIHSGNFDEFCIASAEGLLAENEQARLLAYLEIHPEGQPDYEIYKRLKLHTDTSLAYPDKRSLKKQATHVIPWRFVYYAIEIAALFVVLFLLVNRKIGEQVYTGKVPGYSTVGTEKHITPGNAVQPAPAIAKSNRVNQPGLHIIQKSVAGINPSSETANKTAAPLLTALEPILTVKISTAGEKPGIRRVTPTAEFPVINRDASRAANSASEQTPIKMLGALVKKLNLWKAAETAVTGFNFLTEARLSIVKTVDENGKFSSLSLESDEYPAPESKVK